MPDQLDQVIQRMIDAGEDEDSIGAVIKDFKKNPPAPKAKEVIAEPDTFWGGVAHSLRPGGEVDKAGFGGALGYAKGAIANLPSTIATGVSDAFEAFSDPFRTITQAPEAARAIPGVLSSMWDTTKRAGSEPEAFGEMLGELTGQPAVTAGIAKGAPYLRQPAGRTLAATGRIIKKHQPITGVLPRIAEPRIARTVERAAGAGIERLGNKIAGDVPKRPPPPNAGGALNRTKVPPVENQMADILQEIRTDARKAPGVEAPPPPYSQGAPSPPEQPRVSVRAPKTPESKKAPKGEVTSKDLKTEAKKSEFKPSNDPAKTAEAVSEEARMAAEVQEFLRQAGPDRSRAALERMAARDAGVDTTTGEILDLERPIQAPYNGPRQAPNPAYGSLDDLAQTPVESDAFVPRSATPNTELPPSPQPRMSLFTRLSDETGAVGPGTEELMRSRARRPVNPLRPTVPEGQVTNRQMFDLSARRGAENTLAQESRDFGRQVIPHEFDEDMLFTPDELRNPDIPPMESPVDNPFDPRMAPGGVVSDSTPIAAEPSRWDRLKEAINTFIADEEGSINLGKKEPSVGDRKWSVMHPSGKPIGDIEVTRAEIAAARKAGKVPDGMSDVDYSNGLFQEKLDQLGLDNGYGPNDLSRLQLKYHTSRSKEGSVATNVRNPGQKSTPVGPKGKSWKVSGPKGEKLGDITVTPEEIQEAMSIEGLADRSPDEISKIIYDDKLEDLMIDNGIDPERLGDLNIEQMNVREKRVGSPAKKEIPAEKATEPKPVQESTVSKLDPDAAFAKDGDVNPIAAEADKLHKAGAPDLKFKPLLPKNMQYPVEGGDTFKSRLQTLLTTIADESPAMEAFRAKRLAERDEFIRQVQGEVAPDEPVLRAKDQRLLRSKDVKWSKKYGKFEPR